MRDYQVGEYIEYIPTDEERVLYRLRSNTFYGEIESIDEENGIIKMESVATTGYKDHVKSFTREMTILEAHRVNKLAFRISPALQKAYHHQLEKEKRNQAVSVTKKESTGFDVENGSKDTQARVEKGPVESAEKSDSPGNVSLEIATSQSSSKESDEVPEESEQISDQNEQLPEQIFDPNEQLPEQIFDQNEQLPEQIFDQNEQLPEQIFDQDEKLSEKIIDQNEQLSDQGDKVLGQHGQLVNTNEQVLDEIAESCSEEDAQISTELTDDVRKTRKEEILEEKMVEEEAKRKRKKDPNLSKNQVLNTEERDDDGNLFRKSNSNDSDQKAGTKKMSDNSKESDKNKETKRKRKKDPDLSKNQVYNTAGLRRTKRLHKPKYWNVRYEKKNGEYVQVVNKVAYMTEEQCNWWFSRDFPTKKQAKSVGIKYFKKFHGKGKLQKLYSSSDESQEDENSSCSSKLSARTVLEEQEDGDDSYRPGEFSNAVSSTSGEEYSESEEDSRSFKKSKAKRKDVTSTSEEEYSEESDEDHKSTRKSKAKRKDKELKTKSGKRNTRIRRKDNSDDSDQNKKPEVSKKRQARNSSSKKTNRKDSQLDLKKRKKERLTNSTSSSSASDCENFKPKKKLKRPSNEMLPWGSDLEQENGSKNYLPQKIKKRGRPKKVAHSDLEPENALMNNLSHKIKKKGRPKKVAHLDQENAFKNASSKKIRKKEKPKKIVQSDSEKENASENDLLQKRGRPKNLVQSDTMGTSLAYNKESRRPTLQPEDTPLTTKKNYAPTSNTSHHSQPGSSNGNTSITRLFSPKVPDKVQQRKAHLQRCLKSLGEYSEMGEEDGTTVYYQTPNDETATAIFGVFDLDEGTNRGPLDVDGQYIMLTLVWGAANINILKPYKQQKRMKLKEDILLTSGDNYVLSAIDDSIIKFKCHVPADESFTESYME